MKSPHVALLAALLFTAANVTQGRFQPRQEGQETEAGRRRSANSVRDSGSVTGNSQQTSGTSRGYSLVHAGHRRAALQTDRVPATNPYKWARHSAVHDVLCAVAFL